MPVAAPARRVALALLVAGVVLATAGTAFGRGDSRAGAARVGAAFATAESSLHDVVAAAPSAPRLATADSLRGGFSLAFAAATAALLLDALWISATRRRTVRLHPVLEQSAARGPPRSSVHD